MRAVLAASICCFAATSAAWSASVTVPDNSTGLAGVAGATTALLLDAGVRPQNSGSGVFVLEMKSFHCDQHLNGAFDASNPRAGLPSLTCRINSQNRRGTTAGKPFGEARAMIRKALKNFGGVRRRFTRTGEWNGVPIIDDYGHHPVEIAAVLRAARESTSGQVIAVVQPHRYTRLAALFEQFSTCFNDADTVIVAHVYAAGEAPIAGADRDSLVQGLRAHGHRQVIPLDGAQDLARLIKRLAQPGGIVVCLGAGNITQWAYALPGELAAIGAVA